MPADGQQRFEPWARVRRGLLVALATCLLAAAASAVADAPSRTDGPSAPEADLKGALLIGLMSLVNWPEGVPPGTEPLRLGILGPHAFGDRLNRLAERKTVSGRSVKVLYGEAATALVNCQAVFVARDHRESLGAIANAYEGKPILLLGEEAGFAQPGAGGMVALLVRDEHLWLQINVKAAEAAGLHFRAQLAKYKQVEWIGRTLP